VFLPKINLLARELLVKTSEIDHADWNYRPILGKLQRVRFQLVKSLLQDAEGQGLLEVGYGSGVFFPELKSHCSHISGIDIHNHQEEVMQQLLSVGIESDLRSGSVCDMPFESGSQDIVVAVSALEYVDEIDAACVEIDRVLGVNGILVMVTPGKSPILDAGLQLLGGEDAEENYGDRREKLIAALDRHFHIQQERRWPWPGLPWLTVYKALRLAKRQ
jgi:SAM-dependent methyltransferase